MKDRFIVMALVALGQFGCADITQRPSLEEAPEETQEVAALVEDFLGQAEVELQFEPEHHGERVRGRAVVSLGLAELHIEVIPRDQDSELAEALQAGTVDARLKPEFLEDFQGERSREVGVILREHVAAYLLDHERQPVCGDRMLGVVAEIGLDDVHREEALLWLHLRHASTYESQASAVSLVNIRPLAEAERAESEMALIMSDKTTSTYIDCGDDWSVWGTPDCNSGPCIKTCRVKLSQTTVKGVAVIGVAQYGIPFPVYRTVKTWGHMQVGGMCGVDDGWTYNSCACIAECPDN